MSLTFRNTVKHYCRYYHNLRESLRGRALYIRIKHFSIGLRLKSSALFSRWYIMVQNTIFYCVLWEREFVEVVGIIWRKNERYMVWGMSENSIVVSRITVICSTGYTGYRAGGWSVFLNQNFSIFVKTTYLSGRHIVRSLKCRTTPKSQSTNNLCAFSLMTDGYVVKTDFLRPSKP